MKKVIALLSSIMIILFVSSQSVYADNGVSVSLPSFKITINGTVIDNSHRSYPFVAYKGITYFPMTYYDCRYLGLETKWDKSDGLEITATGVSAGYRDYRSQNVNKGYYTADIPYFRITVNGTEINNTNEQYPLLTFRDVTYFPMTWRFCVNEFGWNYKYSDSDGLTVNSINPDVLEVALKDHNTEPMRNAVLLADDRWYYAGTEGRIFAAKFDDMSHPKMIHQMELNEAYGGGYAVPSMYKKDGRYYLYYHVGSATMGSNYYYLLDKDEAILEMSANASAIGPARSDNGLIYYVSEYLDYPMYKADGYFWCLAEDTNSDKGVKRIYRVDEKTEETTLACSLPADNFTYSKGVFYIVGKDRYLYKMKYNADSASDYELIPTSTKLSNYDLSVTETGDIFYIGLDSKLYMAGSDKPINPDVDAWSLTQMEGYTVCGFDMHNTKNPYKLMILGKDGTEAFKTSDHAESFAINNGILTYADSETGAVFMVDLR